eukprot:scaffold49577_cov36-Phaeocystis_antarctica.AAC.3
MPADAVASPLGRTAGHGRSKHEGGRVRLVAGQGSGSGLGWWHPPGCREARSHARRGAPGKGG